MPSKRWTMAFPPDPASSRAARHAVREAVALVPMTAGTVDAVDIVIGELSANAIIHARTEFAVTVVLDRAHLRVEVFDGDTRPPVVLGVDHDATSGRGMQIVAGVAHDWGWRTATRGGLKGKAVWGSWELPEPVAQS